MSLVNNHANINKPTRERSIFYRDYLKLIVILGLSCITISKIVGSDTMARKDDFTQISVKHPEVSGIYKIDNIALIKNISPDLQGLAKIELKLGETFSEKSIEGIVDIASKRYGKEVKYIRVVQTILNGNLDYFLVYDPKNYLEQEPKNFQWLQWSYFNPTGADGNRIHENKSTNNYFSLKLSTAL